jgi:hypothetical protein
VDDTILFMENDLEEAKNLRLVLCAFQKLPGLKFCIRVRCFALVQQSMGICIMLSCLGVKKVASPPPFRYLGIQHIIVSR